MKEDNNISIPAASGWQLWTRGSSGRSLAALTLCCRLPASPPGFSHYSRQFFSRRNLRLSTTEPTVLFLSVVLEKFVFMLVFRCRAKRRNLLPLTATKRRLNQSEQMKESWKNVLKNPLLTEWNNKKRYQGCLGGGGCNVPIGRLPPHRTP